MIAPHSSPPGSAALGSRMAAVFLLALLAFAGPASAQWATESYPLVAGWNAIWLPLECSDRPIESLSIPASVQQIWRWNPDATALGYTTSPTVPVSGDVQWHVWANPAAAVPTDGSSVPTTTLGRITGNAAYLVKVAPGTAPFTLSLTGKPLPPALPWNNSGVNLVGFATIAPGPNFNVFLDGSAVLKGNPVVYQYSDGSVNSVQITAPSSTKVARNQAYWVNVTEHTSYYGPLSVTVASREGLDFGDKLLTVDVRIKNVTDPAQGRSLTATLAPAPSATPPSGPALAGAVPLRLRGTLNPATGQFDYTAVAGAITTVSLAPGESTDLVFAVDRQAMSGAAGAVFQSLLQVTDSLGLTRFDLPVRAVTTSRSGVWIGSAVLDSVNRVETITGPETDAPTGTADGAGPETTSTVTTTVSTTAGQTTSTKSFAVNFDSNGDAALETAGLVAANVTLTGPTGAPVYAQDVDYTVLISSRAILTNGGSGYTTAPDVTLSGGGGTGAVATATLSGGVRSVTVTTTGSGYSPAPTVSFVSADGAGSGAAGFAILNASGGVVDVRVTNSGSGYTAAPDVVFSGSGGAIATARIGGSVGGVTIVSGGSGYTSAPTVGFVGGGGSGARATLAVNPAGAVAGDSVVHRLNPAIGAVAQILVATQSPAAAGTRDGSATSLVTSVSRRITLNGKSHFSTRRISTGSGAAASGFPVRLIVHAGASGAPTLLQQIYLGTRNGTSFAGPVEASIAALVSSPGATPAGRLGRASSASFPRGLTQSGSGVFGTSASFSLTLGYDDATNPFVHVYHPDHDNWDARYERKLAEGDESYTVRRDVNLTFTAAPPTGVSGLDWGVTTLGGTYTETFTGLRSDQIGVSGSFILHQVSEVPTLTP